MKKILNLRLFSLVRYSSTCASCSKALLNGVVCSDCGKLQPASADVNYFEYLGVAERYNVDSSAVRRSYLNLQSLVHPDKANAENAEVKQLLEVHSSRLNTAYKTLSDPVLRAEYMLCTKETDKFPESPDFLNEMIEMGEEISEISATNKLEQKRSQLLNDIESLKNEMADHFSATRKDEAAQTLIRLRYYLRLLSNVNARLGFDTK